jgi:diguanylate cyclase (GGDEF)-like protein
MNEAAHVFQERIEQLRNDYASQLPDRVEEISTAAEALNAPDTDGAHLTSITLLREYSHKLAGSGATFGFPNISNSARVLEQVTKSLLDQDAHASSKNITQISSLVADLRATSSDILAPPQEQALVAPTQASRDVTESHLILIEHDPILAERIKSGLSNFGYAVDIVSSLSQLSTMTGQANVLAVIWDIDYSGDTRADAAILQNHNRDDAGKFPTIFLSKDTSTKSRLDAVRAGCDVYVMKPFNAAAFVDILDEFTNQKEASPYRILIVDDDLNMANYHKIILEQAGMIVQAVTDPMRLLEEIRDFTPELVLLDLYMSGCTGSELATVIRQNGAFSGIPIVFLSSENELDSQLSALRQGGDDFLNKSINPDQLVESINIRARRFRSLSLLMVQDSLTGLLNHTSTKQALETEIARAQRDNTVVSFAMLDIDHFKSVNDTHGHQIGDWVIKGLARLLKKELRSGDIVGRVGGEEFAVILPGANGEIAHGVIEKIRIGFSEIKHQSKEGEFSCTLSAGVATFPKSPSIMMLTNAADQCLYKAKNGGRNQTVLQSNEEVAV